LPKPNPLLDLEEIPVLDVPVKGRRTLARPKVESDYNPSLIK